MSLLPEPIWPVVVLALICIGDAAMAFKPVVFIAACLRDVRFPDHLWWLLTPIKIAAAVGLIAGIWVPGLGLLTCVCLVLYFVVAIAMHIRARDFGRNLYVNASGMLALCLAVAIWCFLL